MISWFIWWLENIKISWHFFFLMKSKLSSSCKNSLEIILLLIFNFFLLSFQKLEFNDIFTKSKPVSLTLFNRCDVLIRGRKWKKESSRLIERFKKQMNSCGNFIVEQSQKVYLSVTNESLKNAYKVVEENGHSYHENNTGTQKFNYVLAIVGFRVQSVSKRKASHGGP